MKSGMNAGTIRESAARVIQWGPARNAAKYGAHHYASMRGHHLTRTGQVPPIANIFAASSPKGGSQWMKALMDHPIVRAHTGLFTLPQLDYQQTPDRIFPPGTFIPGLYCGYTEYQNMPKLHPHRVIYMFRDPRDLVVSGYYSATTTHRKTHLPEVEAFRDQLRGMPFDDALLALINFAAPRLLETASWVDADDTNIAKFRIEDIAADPRDQVARVLKHCHVELTPDELETVLNDVSRSSLQTKDLATRSEGAESHYRRNPQTFRDVFKPQHHQAIDNIVPDLAARLGYPD